MSEISEERNNLTSIIIPIANNDYPLAHYTGFCIGNVHEYTNRETDPYEIIVVDNASSCGLGGWEWDKVVEKYVHNDDNRGFAAGMNQGFKMSSGHYICFLSNDVFVFENWLSDLKEGLNHVKASNAIPMYGMPWGRAVEARELREKWMDKEPDQYLCDFMDFSCFITTKDIVKEVGLLDEEFGLGYSEDVDWRFRMEKKGYTIKGNKRVNTLHIGGASRHVLEGMGVNFGEIMDKNKDYLAKKWGLDEHGQPLFRRENAEKA